MINLCRGGVRTPGPPIIAVRKSRSGGPNARTGAISVDPWRYDVNRLFFAGLASLCLVFGTFFGSVATGAPVPSGHANALAPSEGPALPLQYREGYVSGQGGTREQARAAALRRLPSGATIIRISCTETASGRWTCLIRYKRG